MLLTFDSIPEFIGKVKSENVKSRDGKTEWTGYVSWDEAIDKALHGDSSYVQDANKLIDKLSVEMPTTRAFKTITSPYGGRCHFADWQVGSPTPMRRRIRSNTDYGPLKIVVSTTSSAGISAETMQKRGAAILALLLRLQEIRPIELYLLAELHGAKHGWHYQFIKMETKPLDVSVAAFCLCNVGFARHLTYRLAGHIDNFSGAWPNGYGNATYAQQRKDRLGLTDEDIMIKEVHATDKLVLQPIEWLKEQLGKYQEGELK
jgi:hypothetical protein